MMDGRAAKNVKVQVQTQEEPNNNKHNTNKAWSQYSLKDCSFTVRMLMVKVKMVRITEETIRLHGADQQLRELLQARHAVSLRTPVKSPGKFQVSGSPKTAIKFSALRIKSSGKLRSNRKQKVRPEKKAEPTEQLSLEKSNREEEKTGVSPGSIILARWEDPLQDQLATIEAVEKDSSTETTPLISGDSPEQVIPRVQPDVHATVDHPSVSVSDTSLSSSRDSKERSRGNSSRSITTSQKRSIFSISPIRTTPARKRTSKDSIELEPKRKKIISEEGKETPEAGLSGLTIHSGLPNKSFSEVHEGSEIVSIKPDLSSQYPKVEDVDIIELLSSDEEDEDYVIEFDELIPHSSVKEDPVTEQPSKDEGSSKQQQQQKTSVEAKSTSAKSTKIRPVKAKLKQGGQKKSKKSSTLKSPDRTTKHDETKKLRNYKIPKNDHLTDEQKKRNRFMPESALAFGEKELEEKLKEKFEELWSESDLEARPDDRRPRKGQIEGEELEEMQDDRWNEIKNLKSDEERLSFAKSKFKNPITSDPGRNLSFQGFKMKKAKQQQLKKVEDILEERNTQFISNGSLHPLSERSQVEARIKKLKISEIKERMMGRIVRILFARGLRAGNLCQTEGQLRLYFAHLKKGLEEQREFLKFYSNNQEVNASCVKEIEKMEEEVESYGLVYHNDTKLRCRYHGKDITFHHFSL